MKTLKNGPQKLLIIGPNFFFHSPAQPTAHSPELIFHIINMSQDTSVSLSVLLFIFTYVPICFRGNIFWKRLIKGEYWIRGVAQWHLLAVAQIPDVTACLSFFFFLYSLLLLLPSCIKVRLACCDNQVFL